MAKPSPQIELKKLTHLDVTDFMTWAGDSTVTESLTWDAYADEASAKIFLQTVAEKHPWFKAIIFNGHVVGAITLSPGQGRTRCRAELGYVIARKFWGQGLATAASRMAVHQGFQDLQIERIEAFVDPENRASIRVAEGAGLILEGHLKSYVVHRGQVRDRLVYSATKK